MIEAPKAHPILRTDALPLADSVRNVWVARVERAVEFKEVIYPGFWAHHSSKFSPWDRIEARAEDGTWFAELLVLDCSRTWAKVHVLSHVKLTTEDASQTMAAMQAAYQEALKDYEIKHRGPRGWSVVRTADGSVMQDVLGTKDAAAAWLASFAKENRPPTVEVEKA